MKAKLLKITLISAFLLISFCPNTLGQSFANQIFEKQIKSVSLKRENQENPGEAIDQLPFILIGESYGLTLRFDELDGSFKNYSFTFVHCNPDWTASDLFSNEYLDGFSEDNINNYNFSSNTVQNYVHYHQSFPSDNMKITKSGNYVLVVYEAGKRDQVILTQRFFAIQRKVTITPLPTFSNSVDQNKTAHQINFKVGLNNIQSSDPLNEFKVVVIKNLDYNSAIETAPAFISNDILSFFGTKMNMEAGNHFRQFDTRGLAQNTKGMGVYDIVYESPFYHTILNPCFSRKNKGFLTTTDLNGKCYPMGASNRNNFYETDYTWTYFYFDASSLDSTQTYYVWGELTNWDISSASKLDYNGKSQQFVGKLYLKQGVYDYAILGQDKTSGKLIWSETEGNYYQTENSYSVLVYYKSFISNYFELIGEKTFLYK